MRTFTDRLTLQSFLKLFFFLGVIGLFLWYVLFQSRLLLAGPYVALSVEPDVVQTESLVAIEGEAHNVVTITLNGRDIFVDEQGFFRESLVLPEGYTIMSIKAKDRYGRETVIERPFMYSSS